MSLTYLNTQILGDGLRSRSADVFVSNDGGYTWRQPEQLKGPHYYGIGDSGGILYVVPSKMEPINTLLLVNKKQCYFTCITRNSSI